MKKILSAAVASIVLTGCVTMSNDTKTNGAATGAAIGCAGGAVLAKIAGGNAATGCAIGAVAGGIAGYEQARQQEIANAERARQEVLATLHRTPGGQSARAEVKTTEVTVTDSKTKETKKIKALDTATLEIPTAMKGTPQYSEVMSKVKRLAEQIADERGSSEIIVSLSPGDAKSFKVALESAQTKTAKGNIITVTKTTDNRIEKGTEVIKVKPGLLNTKV